MINVETYNITQPKETRKTSKPTTPKVRIARPAGRPMAQTEPAIHEELLALGEKLHPKLTGRLTRRKRPGVTSNEIDKEFRYERVLIMQGENELHEYKDDSLPLLKANLKRRLIARTK